MTGDYTPDLMALLSADIIISTPEKWDGISRNWHTRSYVKKVCPLPFLSCCFYLAPFCFRFLLDGWSQIYKKCLSVLPFQTYYCFWSFFIFQWLPSPFLLNSWATLALCLAPFVFLFSSISSPHGLFLPNMHIVHADKVHKHINLSSMLFPFPRGRHTNVSVVILYDLTPIICST